MIASATERPQQLIIAMISCYGRSVSSLTKARHLLYYLVFLLRNIHCGQVNSPFLLSCFPSTSLVAPPVVCRCFKRRMTV